MAKQSGLGDRSFIDGHRISGDIEAFSNISGGNSTLDCTSIEDEGMARLGGKRDGVMAFTAFFNPGAAANDAHAVLSSLPTVDRVVSYCRGAVAGGEVASMVAKQIDYSADRGDSGEFKFGVEAQANGFGLDWGRLLTAGAELASTGPEDLAGIDYGAGPDPDFGLQAFLHVGDVVGTSVTVTLEHSDDDGAADAYTPITGAAFAAATGPGAQRIETARDANVKRWIRAALTGTYTNALVMVAATRNPAITRF